MQAAAAPATRGATPAQPAGSLRGLVADVVGARPRNDDMLCASQMDDWLAAGKSASRADWDGSLRELIEERGGQPVST